MEATFPHLVGWRSVRFWPEGMALDPQQSINGTDTIIPTMRGRWKATAELVFHGEGGYLQWQAFLAQMEGMLGTTLVPCFTRHRPRDRQGRVVSFARTAGLADAQTVEHFGFDAAPLRQVVTAAASPLRSTELDVDLLNIIDLRPGQYFSVGERLHQIQNHWESAPGAHRIRFHPPLREAVAKGALVEVARPVCKMRFTTETEGQFPQDHAEFAPKVTVNFTEAL